MERVKHLSRARILLTNVGMTASLTGLLLLIALTGYGLYTISWSHVQGRAAAVCWAAWCAGGIFLLPAGARLTGLIRAAGGILGLTAVFLLEKQGVVIYALESAAAALCLTSYIAGLASIRPERTRAAWSSITSVVLAACLVITLNIISVDTYRRMDWTSAKFYELSDLTRKTPGNLEKDLKITMEIDPPAEGEVRAVYGDSDSIRDGLTTGGNPDFFMNGVYWLSKSRVRRNMIGIAPKVPEKVKFEVTRDKLNVIVLSVAAGTPAVILLFGIVVWWRRRK